MELTSFIAGIKLQFLDAVLTISMIFMLNYIFIYFHFAFLSLFLGMENEGWMKKTRKIVLSGWEFVLQSRVVQR